MKTGTWMAKLSASAKTRHRWENSSRDDTFEHYLVATAG